MSETERAASAPNAAQPPSLLDYVSREDLDRFADHLATLLIASARADGDAEAAASVRPSGRRRGVAKRT